MKLPKLLENHYKFLKSDIKKRLKEFENIPEKEYFYELCFCICTPQSKASSAMIVQNELQKMDFINHPFNPSELLRIPSNYIRFHNTKANRILQAHEKWNEILDIITSDLNNYEKRIWLSTNILGIGMKEASHFLRNIGFRNLSILDRHILKHLVQCGVFKEIPKVSTLTNYLSVEFGFIEFSKNVRIPIDELDLLFWSYETGMILK